MWKFQLFKYASLLSIIGAICGYLHTVKIRYKSEDNSHLYPYYAPLSTLTTFDVQNCFLSTIEDNRKSLQKSTADIISDNFYNFTIHHITSIDGYITTIYRITGGPLSPPTRGKHPVLLMHGLGSSSRSWLIQPGNRNLALKLADAGYDVWLPSYRGSTESLGHLRWDSDKDLEYWDFTSEDIATKDVPLIISMILEKSSHKKLSYICQSLGCSTYHIALSLIPSLNDVISSGILLAPGPYGCHSYSPTLNGFKWLIPQWLESTIFRMMGGRVDKNPKNFFSLLDLTPEKICSWALIKCGICANFMAVTYGYDGPQINYTDFSNILSSLRDNMPLRLLFHANQIHRGCHFRKYNYGKEINLIKYGMVTPPLYNLSAVTAPTYLFYGEGDNMVTPWDMIRLKNELPVGTVQEFYKVNWPFFNHVDFMMASDADLLVYNKVLQILNEQTGNKRKT